MKNIKRISLVLSICIIMLTALSVHAEKVVINAGIINNYDFSGNTITDYAQGCVTEIFEYSDNPNIEFTVSNLREGLSQLQDGRLNFLCMVPFINALTPYVDYSSEPMATGFLALCVNADSKIYYGDFNNFDNMKIGMLQGTELEVFLKEYSAKNGFKYTPVYFDSMDAILSALSSGNVDAVFSPITKKPDKLRIIAKCGNIPYYCAVKKGNSTMLARINNAITSLKEAYPFYISDRFSEYFKIPYCDMVGYTESEYTALLNKENFKIFAPEDNYPLSYFDSETHSYRGIYIDIVRSVAENAGFSVEFISYDQSAMSMNGIVMGKADAIISVSGSKQGLIEASTPYASISYMPISRSDKNVFEDSHARVGILAADAWITDYLEDSYPQWYIEKYDTANSLLSAAEKGKISIALLSSPDMQTKTSLIAHPKLSIVPDFTVNIPVSLGISKITCNQHIINLLNKTIKSASVSQSELEEKVYTLSHIYVPNLRDMLYTNKHWIIFILAVIALIIIFIKLRELHYRRLSNLDALTQLHNRRYFENAAMKALDKDSSSYLLASIDVRNFKLINDRFGHIIGNQALGDIASKIKEIFKEHALYARSHSDCFLILARDTSANRDRLDKLANINVYIHNTTKYRLPIKIGVCPIKKYNPALTLSHYIDRANIAKESPAGVSNSPCYFTDDMGEQLEMMNSIESEMVRALERGDFIVYYQPKYELKTDKIIGAEALVRWNHETHGIISPGLFIPLFEKNGFIVELDFYVYECVLKMLRGCINSNQPIVPISMNVSRCHLSDDTFVDRLEALVIKYNVPKSYIEMEITESIFSQEDDAAIVLVQRLREHGFTISMDDFGSGYSSLNLLRQIPIDTLKIDKGFIDNFNDSQRSSIIIEEIIVMAARLKIKTICEGVETVQQRDFLKNADCNMVQGFFYSRPLPYDDFIGLINSSN